MHEKHMNKRATTVAFLSFALSAAAAIRTLPTPPESAFADAESSVNVPLPTDEGRRIRLTLGFESSPSNAVMVAFGNDLNCSETLESEETELVVGCDCGEWFVRDEVKVRGEGEQRNVQVSFVETEQEPNLDCSPSPSTFTLPTPLTFTSLVTFNLKQPKERWNLAKVTTHNLVDSNLTIIAEFYDRGKVIFLR